MMTSKMWRYLAILALALPGLAQQESERHKAYERQLAEDRRLHPIPPLGSPAPDFSLPGVDGKVHKLSDYAASPVLVIVFTCNHCPIASIYEGRIQKMADDYRPKGVAVVAIQPNDPECHSRGRAGFRRHQRQLLTR